MLLLIWKENGFVSKLILPRCAATRVCKQRGRLEKKVAGGRCLLFISGLLWDKHRNGTSAQFRDASKELRYGVRYTLLRSTYSS